MPDGTRSLEFCPEDRAFRIVLPATFMAVRQTLTQLRSRLQPLQLSADLLGNMEIVLAEALNNIVEHAYSDGTGIIEIEITQTGESMDFRVVDEGMEMPGGQVPVGTIRDYPADPEKMPEGGFGWFLIHDLTNRLSYQRAGSKNILLFGFSKDPVS